MGATNSGEMEVGQSWWLCIAQRHLNRNTKDIVEAYLYETPDQLVDVDGPQTNL